jgi:hypothetical protein
MEIVSVEIQFGVNKRIAMHRFICTTKVREFPPVSFQEMKIDFTFRPKLVDVLKNYFNVNVFLQSDCWVDCRARGIAAVHCV